MIDERAIIHPSAKIADNVTIGPWSVVGENVTIGEGTTIGPHVVIGDNTTIGKDNHIFQFASVGEAPQDKKFKGGDTYLTIGDGNTIREFCTLNRGVEESGGLTSIGSHNLLMAYVHIAHDCHVGNHTVFANNASLAGHVIVHDYAILSGFAGVHQFCVVGAYSFVAKGSMVAKDVPPYVLVSGYSASACGLNTVGLKRRGFTTEVQSLLRKAYKIIYRSELTLAKAIEELEAFVNDSVEVASLVSFLKDSKRGIVR